MGLFRVSIAVFISVISFNSIGLNHYLDGVIHQTFVSVKSRLHQFQSSVLLISVAPSKRLDVQSLHDLIVRLDTWGASKILLWPFSDLPLSAYDDLSQFDQIVFGRYLDENPGSGMLELSPMPDNVLRLKQRWGLVLMHPDYRGSLPLHHPFVEVNGSYYPTLEWLGSGRDPTIGSRKPFMVDYWKGNNYLPEVGLDEALNGKLIQSMVKDKTVIIGLGADVSLVDFPANRKLTGLSGVSLTALEYQGFVVQSLLKETYIRFIPAWMFWLGLLLFIPAAVYYLIQFDFSLNRVHILALQFGCFMLVAYAAFDGLRLWLEPGSWVLTYSLSLVVVSLKQFHGLRAAMSRIRMQAETICSDRFIVAEEDHHVADWSRIGQFLREILDAGDFSVWRYSSEGLIRIFPKSQDPSAVASWIHIDHPKVKETMESLQLNSFSDDSTNRVAATTYLIPLSYQGSRLGLCVLSKTGQSPEDTSNTINFLNVFKSDFSSKMLSSRFEASDQTDSRILNLLKIKNNVSKNAYAELSNLLVALDRRLLTLEQYFLNLDKSLIVFDGMGDCLFINGPMKSFLAGHGVARDEKIPLMKFLRTILQKNKSELQGMMRHVMMSGSLSVPLAFSGTRTQKLVLHMHPIQSDALQTVGGTDSDGVSGIVCELSDVTLYSEVSELKGYLGRRLGVQLRNNLGAIEMSAGALEYDDLEMSLKRELIESIQSKVSDSTLLLEESESFLDRMMEYGVQECYPVDGLEILGRAWSMVEAKVLERGLQFETVGAKLMQPVLGSQAFLLQLFASILTFLARDSRAGTSIRCELEETQTFGIFRFSNQGYGIPEEAFRRHLDESTADDTAEFSMIKESIRNIETWGGDTEYQSQLDKGYRFTIRLRKFY